LKKIILFLGFLFAGSANAAVEFNGKVTSMFADGGIILATVCVSSESCKKFWIKPESDYSKAVISMLLSAKVTKSDIWIQGYNSDSTSIWPYDSAHRFAAMHLK
jgi:hypothetical protein